MTGDLAEYRQRVRSWLAAEAPRRGWLRQPGAAPARPPAGDPDAGQRYLARARDCQRALFDAGYAGIAWPREYGGQGLSNREQVVFNQESAGYDLPLVPFAVGLGMCGPTILALGTEQQKRRYLEPLLRGEEIWCQLFSEPDAGSDVAGLRTRAVPADGGYLVSGQKVWTSGAHFCAFGILLARTDPSLPKHRGITMFVADMRAPGVTIRPLRQMNGAAGFNEVFFEDVRVPAEAVLGELNDGWRAALVTLMTERVSIGTGRPTGDLPDARTLAALAEDRGRHRDEAVRQAVGDIHLRERALAVTGERINAAILAGRVPGPEGSVAKLVVTELTRRATALGFALAGPDAAAWDPDRPEAGRWAAGVLLAPAASIAGGTDDVMRNIIGERVLGLPREPAVDRDLPFQELLGAEKSG